MRVGRCDEGDVLLRKLEEDGKGIWAQPDVRCYCCDSIVVQAETFVELMLQFRTIESRDALTGLVFNIAPVVGMHCCSRNVERNTKFWVALTEMCKVIDTFPNIHGLVQGAAELALRDGQIHDGFLEFLANPEFEAPVLKPYLFTALYEMFPEMYFQSNKEFFASLLPRAMSEPHLLGRRARQLQVLYSLHLTSEQLHSVPGLIDCFWNLLFEMAEKLGSSFYDYIPFVRKMKMCTRDFFDEKFEQVTNALTKLEDPGNSVQTCFEMVVYFVGLFPFFDRENMIRFLGDVVTVVDSFDRDMWTKINTLTLAFDCSIGDQLSQDELRAFFDYIGSLPDSSGKYYLGTQFRGFFKEIDGQFLSNFGQKMCSWVTTPTFNPVAFSYMMALMADRFEDDDSDPNLNRAIPSLFQCCASKDPLIVRYAVKAFLYLWRNGCIVAARFLDTFLALIPDASPESLRYFFKALDEILENDDVSTVESIDRFATSHIASVSESGPILAGFLIDCEISVQRQVKSEPDEATVACFNVAKSLLTTDVQQCYPMASRVIAYCVRHANIPPDDILATYQRMLQLLNTPGIEQDVLASLAYYTARVSDNYKDKEPFLYPVELVNRWIGSSSDDDVGIGLEVIRIVWPQMRPLVVSTLADKVIAIAKRTTCRTLVDRTFNFVKSLVKSDESVFQHSIKDLEVSAFQGAMAIYRDSPVWHMRGYCVFFQFVESIVRAKKSLSYSECFDMIGWLTFFDKVTLKSLVRPLCMLVESRLLSDVALRQLWENTLSRAQEDWADIFTLQPLLSLLRTFVDNYSSVDWPVVVELMQLVEKVWNSNSTDWRYQNVLEPLYLMLCTMHRNIISFDTAILRSACESMQSMEYRWPYATMIGQLLDIYEHCSSFHGFRDEACRVLLHFFTLDSSDIHKMHFTRPLIEKLTDTLRDNFSRYPDLLGDLITEYPDDSEPFEQIRRTFSES